jgi:hypothetical protein
MTGYKLPDDHNAVRYCKPTHIGEDELPSAEAFLPGNNEDLSANWLEYFKEPDRVRAVDYVRCALLGKSYGLGRGGRLAVLNVREIREATRRVGCALHVEHQPKENDPSHSGIVGWAGAEDVMIVALKLKQIVLKKNLHPARSPRQ